MSDLMIYVSCPKCRVPQVKIDWHKDGNGKRSCSYMDVNPASGEHMHFHCPRCSYDWTNEVTGE